MFSNYIKIDMGKMTELVRFKRSLNSWFFSLLVLFFSLSAKAEPTVDGGTISWPDDGWYQVQDVSSYESVCEGGTSCLLPNGTYNVINHSTSQRWDGITVPANDSAPVPGTPSDSDPFVVDDIIYFPALGWIQVLDAGDYSSVCEGGRSCQVSSGEYIVINHDYDQRWNISVEGSEPEKPYPAIEPPVVIGLEISWGDEGWYQVQSADDYSTVCEGGRSCLVDAGTYNIVNHTSGDRWNNIVVAGGIEPEPETPEGDLLTPLSYTVVDAEFSVALDRIILVSANPNELIIFNGHAHTSHSIELPFTPSSVSISPDGTHAAVGHDGSVSYVNLITSQLLNTVEIGVNVFDVVLGLNDYAYAFPIADMEQGIVSVNLITEQQTQTEYRRIYGNAHAKLHPSGETMYAVDGRGVSSNDIYRIEIVDGVISEVFDSPYHSDFNICGDIWMSNDGHRAYNGCGTAFRTAEQEDNLRYRGSLSHLEGVNFFDYSAKTFQIVAIPDASQFYASDDAADDTQFQLYSSARGAFEKTRNLPAVTVGERVFTNHGKFVFFSENGTQVHVILRANASAGLLNDFAIWTTPTSAVDPAPGDIVPFGDEPVVSDGTIRWAGTEFYEVYLQSDMTLLCSGGNECSVGPGTYRVVNTESYQTWSDVVVTQAIPVGSLPVANSDTNSLHVLGYDVIDAEYSHSLDRMILISSNPSALHIVGGSPLEDRVVELSVIPQSVSVSPNGNYAAVSHDGWVSYVNLQGAFVRTVPALRAAGGDIVMANSGYAYVFPFADQWVPIHSINLESAEETISRESAVYAGTKAKIHPNGEVIYGVDQRLEQYDISAGPVSLDYTYSSSDYESCNDLWMSQDGRRIFTQCGNVFRASSAPEEDRSFNGNLSGVNNILHLDHSIAADQVTLIPAEPDWWEDDQLVRNNQIQFYDYQILNYESSQDLPSYLLDDTAYQTFGKFVFYNAAGNNVYVIVSASEDSGLVRSDAIWNIPR